MTNRTNEGQKAISTPCNFAVLVKQGESAAEGIYKLRTADLYRDESNSLTKNIRKLTACR